MLRSGGRGRRREQWRAPRIPFVGRAWSYVADGFDAPVRRRTDDGISPRSLTLAARGSGECCGAVGVNVDSDTEPVRRMRVVVVGDSDARIRCAAEWRDPPLIPYACRLWLPKVLQQSSGS
jgi:hypothetical protein